LLKHDTFGKDTTVQALPAIIQYYKENGYRFGVLDTTSSGYHHVHRFPRR
jgi:peptidoglycan/xylan/chitin deacetylase (PgdA/CDA1 family)